VQLTTDDHKTYLRAIEGAFGSDVDHAQLNKMYGGETGTKSHEKKYRTADKSAL
jgi:hypothetical protein